eukprot:TRINITY_DN97321_c0_g1_i1.p1 TRINITY_DN97321_c0_g1~~TRINITY_DN97321_c0_g1_i1.p1  ORF type:complete len:115 (-),score=11.16 TRINITY_DN97321_c0_g1_i1:127-426(-)
MTAYWLVLLFLGQTLAACVPPAPASDQFLIGTYVSATGRATVLHPGSSGYQAGATILVGPCPATRAIKCCASAAEKSCCAYTWKYDASNTTPDVRAVFN